MRITSVLLVILFTAGLCCSCKKTSSDSPESSVTKEETSSESVPEETSESGDEPDRDPDEEEFDRLMRICLEYNCEEVYTASSEDEDVSDHCAVLYPEGLSDNEYIVSTFLLYDYLRIDKYRDMTDAMEVIEYPEDYELYCATGSLTSGEMVSVLMLDFPKRYIAKFRSDDCVVSININIGNSQTRDTFLLIMNDLKQMGLYVDEAAFSSILTNYYPMTSDGTYLNENVLITTEEMPLQKPESDFSADTVYVSYQPEDIDGVWLDKFGFFARFDIENNMFYTSDRSEYEIVSIDSGLITVKKVYSAYENDMTAEVLSDQDGLITFPFKLCEDGSVDIMGHRIFRPDSKDGEIVCGRVLKEADGSTYRSSDPMGSAVTIKGGEYKEGPLGNYEEEKSGVEIRDCMLIHEGEILGYFRYSGDRTVWFVKLGDTECFYGLASTDSIKIISKGVWLDKKGDYMTYKGNTVAFYLPDGELNGVNDIISMFDNFITCEDGYSMLYDLVVIDPDTIECTDQNCFEKFLFTKADSFTGLLIEYSKEQA